MINLLVKKFVKEYDRVEKMSVRTAYGVLASIIGIFCNVFLFAAKAFIGTMLHSVAVTADAFNNLSDAGSSLIGLVGVKMAEKPADAKHPFGHGRLEYIAALIVSFMIMEVGFTFLKAAAGKIREPQTMDFQPLFMVVLLGTIGVKLWLALFNRKLGQRINSQVLRATAADAANDILITASTIVSLLCWRIFGVNIDGWTGILVALAVMWAGFGIARDTLEPLIGAAITLETYQEISDFVERYEGIVGSHDLIVHNYGPNRSMASIHAEVPNDVNVEVSHEVIDKIERDALEELGVYLVIHMDPIETKDEITLKVKEQVVQAAAGVNPDVSIHDFRMVEGKEQINLIFDMTIPYHVSGREAEIEKAVEEAMRQIDSRYYCVITVEKGYVSVLEEKKDEV